MKRKCRVIATSTDKRKAICIDVANQMEILGYLNQSERHKKKFRHITELILEGHVNRDLYDSEEINDKCKGVTAMKFFKGQENDRIYCKEQKTENGVYIIVTSELYTRKKSQKVSKKEIPIIEKVGQYEYEIQKNSD